MKNYKELLKKILNDGRLVNEPRTGSQTFSLFSSSLSFNMEEGFPLITGRKLSTKNIFSELQWFLEGNTNLKWLLEQNNNIWFDDGYKFWISRNNLDHTLAENSKEEFKNKVMKVWENGFDLGPIYGAQWRGTYPGSHVDQISKLIELLKSTPFSRRHIVEAWNADYLKDMSLTPCHKSFQCYVDYNDFGNIRLNLKFFMRSSDTILGLPYNIASYALLLHLIAKEVNMVPGILISDLTNAHIYLPHYENTLEYLSREEYSLPTIDISETSLFNFDYKKVRVLNYQYGEPLHFQLITGKL